MIGRFWILLICLTFIPSFWWAANGASQEKPMLQYLDGTAQIWANPDENSRPVGKLLVSAPIQVLSQQGPWKEVALEGWTQKGAERIIYAAPGVRVLHAAIKKSAVEQLEFTTAIDDVDTGLVWTRTRLHGWLKSPILQPTLNDLWARAEPLFAKRCTACHQRRIPHHYTANQWVSFLKIMGPRTGLPKDDQFLIRAYLQYQAKDSDRLKTARYNAKPL